MRSPKLAYRFAKTLILATDSGLELKELLKSLEDPVFRNSVRTYLVPFLKSEGSSGSGRKSHPSIKNPTPKELPSAPGLLEGKSRTLACQIMLSIGITPQALNTLIFEKLGVSIPPNQMSMQTYVRHLRRHVDLAGRWNVLLDLLKEKGGPAADEWLSEMLKQQEARRHEQR